MQGWSERWIDVAGVRTRFLELGSGPPLILFHGGEMGHRYQADSADVHVVNKAGHLSMRERPAAFNGALRGFIAARDPD